MILHNLRIGDVGFYENQEVVIEELVDPLTIKVFGLLGKECYWCSVPHPNKILKWLGFTVRKLTEVNVLKSINISFYNFKINHK